MKSAGSPASEVLGGWSNVARGAGAAGEAFLVAAGVVDWLGEPAATDGEADADGDADTEVVAGA